MLGGEVPFMSGEGVNTLNIPLDERTNPSRSSISNFRVHFRINVPFFLISLFLAKSLDSPHMRKEEEGEGEDEGDERAIGRGKREKMKEEEEEFGQGGNRESGRR